jgi:ubiquinol-cytochrome c reductase cytochrome c1 subunit
VLPNSAMPDVFWATQGLQKAVFKKVTDADGDTHEVFERFKPLGKGQMSSQQFDAMTRDITNFLAYAGEPIKLERQSLGIKVLFFLLVLFLFVYFLKKEIWRDVH